MIEAGSETTSQVLNNCLVGLLSNPNAVKKAHEELDRVVGSERSPMWEDEEKLEYVCVSSVLCSVLVPRRG